MEVPINNYFSSLGTTKLFIKGTQGYFLQFVSMLQIVN
jgi:hypothetical protein